MYICQPINSLLLFCSRRRSPTSSILSNARAQKKKKKKLADHSFRVNAANSRRGGQKGTKRERFFPRKKSPAERKEEKRTKQGKKSRLHIFGRMIYRLVHGAHLFFVLGVEARPGCNTLLKDVHASPLSKFSRLLERALSENKAHSHLAPEDDRRASSASLHASSSRDERGRSR